MNNHNIKNSRHIDIIIIIFYYIDSMHVKRLITTISLYFEYTHNKYDAHEIFE